MAAYVGTAYCAMPIPTNDTVLLPPRLFGTIGWYVSMAGARRAVVDTSIRYDKRHKGVHRYDIADVRGAMQLTVPLGKPHGCAGTPTWADAAVSRHDEWWLRHRVTLESAYGRTPYFEFIIDRFDSILCDPAKLPVWPAAIDLCRAADEAVRSVLCLPYTAVQWMPADTAVPDADNVLDLRRAGFDLHDQPRYWQVRQHSLGFIAGLSVLDLIFNLGPESALYIAGLTALNG